MNAQALTMLYTFSHMVVRKNIEGISHEESLASPTHDANCINWVLGHIVATRDTILRGLKQEPVWSLEEAAPYVRGSSPLDVSRALPLERIRKDFERSQERILAGIAGLSAADFSIGATPETIGEGLATIQFHDSYHAGQLGILRRLAGKPGAIK